MKNNLQAMPNYEKNWVRLPLERAHNVRELGGYPVAGGGQTAYHRFLRADDISTLSDADVAFLLSYGVGLVIDLRSPGEAKKSPDRLCGLDGVEYVQIPFLGKNVADVTQMNESDMELGLGALYVSMLKNQELTKEIFEAIETAPEGCVLFHCSAGKDRTGVLAMLLMSLAGADKQDCMTNYAQSYINLTRNPELAQLSKIPEYAKYEELMFSLPETIGACYDFIVDQYGSTEHYLEECGLSSETIEVIKRRLLAD